MCDRDFDRSLRKFKSLYSINTDVSRSIEAQDAEWAMAWSKRGGFIKRRLAQPAGLELAGRCFPLPALESTQH